MEPYALAPWKPKDLPVSMPPVIRVLRGDYFCLPFGSSAGVKHVHGDAANANWKLIKNSDDALIMQMQTRLPAGEIPTDRPTRLPTRGRSVTESDNSKVHLTKILKLREGHSAVYQEYLISGLDGNYNFGHHAILKFPETGRPYSVNVSPFHFGSVKPDRFSNPEAKEYGALKTAARFTSLGKVPLAEGGFTSLQEYPARRGYDDLILVASRPGKLAWTAATLDGYVWISLKDPTTLPSTLFWISNGGRHAEPWNGVHTARLGLEEVCGYYSDGLEISRKDLLKKHKIPMTLRFSPDKPTSIRLIHLVAPVPKGFGRVEVVTADPKPPSITIEDHHGRKVQAKVDWKFLYSEAQAV